MLNRPVFYSQTYTRNRWIIREVFDRRQLLSLVMRMALAAVDNTCWHTTILVRRKVIYTIICPNLNIFLLNNTEMCVTNKPGHS